MARRQARSQDVAKLAGVSRTTVSFVLNDVPGVKITEETRRRVLEAARELDYYPTAAARSLASGKTHRIGLILGEGQERLAADAFLPTFLQGVTASVHQRGYLLEQFFVVHHAPNIQSGVAESPNHRLDYFCLA